jgi:LSD1 subclass zinc finger protein
MCVCALNSSSCAMLMAYPDGVQQIKCPGCATVNNTPPAETTMNMGAAARGAGIDPAVLAQLPEDLRQQIAKRPPCRDFV